MPLQAANLKQTPDHHTVLATFSEAVRFLPHHAKPLRKRHVLLLVVSLTFVSAIALESAVLLTRRTADPRALFSGAVTSPQVPKTTIVRSSLGFGFVYSPEQFTATAQSESSNSAATNEELSQNNPLTSVALKPLPSFVPASEAATELEVKVETDAAAFATFKASIQRKTDIAAITADYFTPKPTNLADITEDARTTESINGSLLTKAIYTVEPKFAGNPTKTIVWSTQVEGRPVALIIRGITNGATTPSSMQSIVQSMQFNTDVKVKGLSIFAKDEPVVIEQKYVADLVSPAVVKVYHAICGSLEYNGALLSDDTCFGKTGSGFIVSSDGYIATNGHVVVYGAKDMLAGILLQNKTLLQSYLTGLRLTKAQVAEVMSRPDLTAAAVSKVYNMPDNNLRLKNQRSITIVATGESALEIDSEAELKQVITMFESTDDLKQATVVGYDYDAKDQLTLIANPQAGFSASDVALLKVEANNAPFVPLADTDGRQNQAITLFGFPADADNPLIDSSKVDVTVTNGTINAVRDAAGGGSKLYQTDADASHGNSGGPAVDETGAALGILTYRYDSGQTGDAAKSYIRDISDFSNLLNKQRITLNTDSKVQEAWLRGLDYYSKQYYSKALKEFEIVQQLYPAHRLAGQYADMARKAIDDGKDIQDPSALLLVLGAGAGLGGLAGGTLLIVRHYGRHKLYKFYLQHKPHLQASH